MEAAPNGRSLVIFDCDGVLVDSEPISVGVLREIVDEAGVSIAPEDAYRRWLGRSLSSIVDDLRTETGLAIDSADLDRMRARLFARFRAELRPTPHLAAALDALAGPLCVASSSSVERIALSLELTGLARVFGAHVFSVSMVTCGKPAPDLFLHAAGRMGRTPAECVVVEDSVAGIRAARAAGMKVIAYAGGAHVGPAGLRPMVEALSPDAIVDDMRKLPGTIAAIV